MYTFQHQRRGLCPEMQYKVNVIEAPDAANLKGWNLTAPRHALHRFWVQRIQSANLLNGERSWHVRPQI